MKYLLDANIIIRAIGAVDAPLAHKIAACDEGDVVTSAIAYAEVAHGSWNGKRPALWMLDKFAQSIAILPFDQLAAKYYAMLSFKRGSYDRLIAAHALSLGLTLVTDNISDFADVPDLRLENWTLPL